VAYCVCVTGFTAGISLDDLDGDSWNGDDIEYEATRLCAFVTRHNR